MKKLISRHTGVEFGYDETMAKNTRDYEIVVDDEPKPKRRKRTAKPKAKKVEDTTPKQQDLDLDGLLDGLDNS